ncbi:phospholipase A2 inhibitor and Ly6/PLAUR domain-containing protein-like [Lacerta agilis]|uniref:phospholipase A2 inhibitor and Ly6/PLAUR domain-containing protein-like n=1 Tax=Lacerta agilis TaxID=80427 RepID=UPI001419E3B3|nr:phospholipase A2 inhibitor and Ly6/PLAUR domain-containing protein-like [Lacerta agilis]
MTIKPNREGCMVLYTRPPVCKFDLPPTWSVSHWGGALMSPPCFPGSLTDLFYKTVPHLPTTHTQTRSCIREAEQKCGLDWCVCVCVCVFSRLVNSSQLKSRTMQTPLFISLLAAFIALGMALECEQCTAQISQCSGPMIQCTQEQDTCVFQALSSSIAGLVEQKVFEKGCSSSKLCRKGPKIVNFGPFGTTAIETHCCVGDACRTTRFPTPRRNTTLNGRQCSTCSPGAECKFPPVQCAGEETKCFEISGTTNLAGQTVNSILKGCANELACQEMEIGTKTFGNVMHEVKSAKCTDGAASATPGSLGLLFPALSGLLLVKFLA